MVIDGKIYTVEDAIRGTYVSHIANAIVNNPNESAAVKDYAAQLLEAEQNIQ